MRILFIARHFSYFRNYDFALRELAARGHHIHLAVEKHEALGGRQAVEALARECPSITFGEVPDRTDDRSANLARRLRFGLDYLRYLEPFYDEAPLRRVRARDRTPNALVRLAEWRHGARWRRLVAGFLHRLDVAVPPPPALIAYVREQRPDLLVITPLVDLGSQQIDYLRVGRLLGIPTVLAVWSWDHLSSKAYLREYPDRVLVWNDTQRREAADVHRVPPQRVVVTGAQCFDHWFDRRPSRDRETFCAQLGLPPDRPLILYVGTGLILGSPREAPFVREWLTRLRASDDPRVASAAVLVRPHPSQTEPWQGVDFGDLGPVAIWTGNPIDDRTRADYFDSLYHSDAVVGINTSAFIEAAIVGREVLAILPRAFYDNHEGTVHFRYLLEIGGGLLRVSRDFDSHLQQLSAALRRTPSAEHPHRAFLEAFVRPRGLGVPAVPAFVQAVEEARDVRPSQHDRVPMTWWSRPLVGALARRLDDPRYEAWVLSPRELGKVTRVRTAAARKEDHRRVLQEASDSARAARAREKADAMAAKRERVDAERRRRRSEQLTPQ